MSKKITFFNKLDFKICDLIIKIYEKIYAKNNGKLLQINDNHPFVKNN